MTELAEHARGFCSGATLTINHTTERQSGEVWQRIWSAYAEATVWPTGKFDSVLLPLPRGKGALAICLHAAASVLNANGRVIVYGDNDLGARSTGKAAEGLFADIESIYAGDHGRIWRMQKPVAGVIKRSIDDFAVGAPPWRSYPGLFASGGLDDASALLIDALPVIESSATVMDFACGIGVLALALSNGTATAVDNDPLALYATQQNAPAAKTVLCGAPGKLTGQYDIIVSNPPIHEGNEKSFVIVDQLIRQIPKLLKPQGIAYLVAQVTVPIARLAKEAGLNAEEVAANHSFRVTRLSGRGA